MANRKTPVGLRRGAATVLGAIVVTLLGQASQAQTWPHKPVKIVVPVAPGGPSDAMARITAQRLTATFGQPFLVENQAGAGGAIATETVVRAAGDGYTLYWVTAGQITIMPLISRLSYDPAKRLVPITAVAENRFVLVANANSLPIQTANEFVDRIRSEPGHFSYAHAGSGTITHLAMELLARRAGLQMIGVAYKGIAPAFTDVLAGHVTTMFASLGDVSKQSKNGSVRLLAVSSDRRAGQIPEVPTINESVSPGFNIVSWNGLMAPPGTPKEIADRISAEVVRATKSAEFADRLTSLGFDPVGSRPEEFAAVIAAEVPVWAEAVKAAGLKPD